MNPERGGWVLYDGSCGICARWVPFWGPTLERLGLGTAPLQSRWVANRTGLTADVLQQDLRLLHTDGRLTSGADVYRFVMRQLWWVYPFYLLSVAPGGRLIFDWGYRTFARHRQGLSVVCRLEPPSARDA
jgi:predicted DCC family thiol-disulfide oxidoreductase YuxK